MTIDVQHVTGFAVTAVSYMVIVSGAICMGCYALRFALEALVFIEDRTLRIIKVQPALCRYLANRKLYDRMVEEHRKKSGAPHGE